MSNYSLESRLNDSISCTRDRQAMLFSAETTMKNLRQLQINRWIDRGTRAIFFDVIIYNPNINLFAHIR